MTTERLSGAEYEAMLAGAAPEAAEPAEEAPVAPEPVSEFDAPETEPETPAV